jgi:hypothetical protein
MAIAALLFSLITMILSSCWGVVCVRRCSRLALRATRRERAPEKWQSRLAELEAEVLSLSSAFEKAARLMQRQNSRAGMQELRAERVDAKAPPPIGASKQQLRDYYAPKIAALRVRPNPSQLSIVDSPTKE